MWVLRAEDTMELLPLLGKLLPDLGVPNTGYADEGMEQAGRRVLAELRSRSIELSTCDPEHGGACLILLDNVSNPSLLAETQLALLPREDWLHIIVTTQLGEDTLPASQQKSLCFISVDSLQSDDALRLIEEHQPKAVWPVETKVADTEALVEIVHLLGGFTLVIESVAIYLGLHTEIRPEDYLTRLREEGVSSTDQLTCPSSGVIAHMQHRDKQLGLVLSQTLDGFSDAELAAVLYAAILPSDSIPWAWIKTLLEQEYPNIIDAPPGYHYGGASKVYD